MCVSSSSPPLALLETQTKKGKKEEKDKEEEKDNKEEEEKEEKNAQYSGNILWPNWAPIFFASSGVARFFGLTGLQKGFGAVRLQDSLA